MMMNDYHGDDLVMMKAVEQNSLHSELIQSINCDHGFLTTQSIKEARMRIANGQDEGWRRREEMMIGCE